MEAQKQYAAMVTSENGGKSESNSGKSKGCGNKAGDFLSIKSWSMKKTEDSVKREGRTWYWCPHQKVEGSYDGLYVMHKPEEHDEGRIIGTSFVGGNMKVGRRTNRKSLKMKTMTRRS